jgi:serine/threonine-protein kinase
MALTAVGVFLTGSWIGLGWVNPFEAPLSYSVAVAGIALCGVALFALARLGTRDPARALDISLAVEAAAGLFISLAENATPYNPDEPVRSFSNLAVWITVYALAAPVKFGKALAAALATAAMAPLGLSAQVGLGNVASPPWQLWLVLSAAPVLLAIASPLLGRLIYRLGTEVKAAREYGGYQLVERIGGGGMGEVWRARHHAVGRMAAVKLIRPELFAGGPDGALAAQRRFEREAEATAALHSPHTVALYNYGVSEDGMLYYVMELLEGFDLDTLVKRFGPMPAARAVNVLLQVCDSLAEAHQAGLIHRDIKPANIVLQPAGASGDFAKVVDFGLARPLDGERSVELMAGTPAYMAPEILSGAASDARADIYSLGCVAYWLLTGRPAFEAATAALTMQAHLHETPVPPEAAPPQLDALVMACLEKDPARRPASARDLAAALLELRLEPAWTRLDADRWWAQREP